jgi:hypothetical protein
MNEDGITWIEYFELFDGEVFGIQVIDPEDGSMTDQILLEREIAIEIAEFILSSLKNEGE